MKLGSLFDGIGGFPFVAQMCGVTPVWASEIETAPVSITKQQFPQMQHLGDITKINGAEIEPVDIITFGSPCQDLSMAGQRKGLKHEDNGDEETTRSGLFMEAIRIVKEMRCKTNGKYPAFVVWENVPGAFSSNKGEDFRTVLEEICKIKDSTADIPSPNKGKWATAGAILADGYSVAWRTIDAQFWGVPQRRRRIYLVADFRGQSAAKILFKSESVSWDIATGRKEGQGIAESVEGSFGKASGFKPRNGSKANGIGYAEEQAPTLGTDQNSAVLCGVTSGAQFTGKFEEIAQTLRARDYKEPQAVLCAGFNGHKSSSADITYGEELSPTLESNMPGNIAVYENHQHGNYKSGCGTLRANGGDVGGGSENLCVSQSVRRLTPRECERLQGYPDDYTLYGHDGKIISDTARYKALGNSLALPCAYFVISGISEVFIPSGQRYESSGQRYELCCSVHAEANAVINAQCDVSGATLYLAGKDMATGEYIDGAPCMMCSRLIKNAGISKVINRKGVIL